MLVCLLLLQALDMLGTTYRDLRATVYARCPESLDSGLLQLKRIAVYCGQQHAKPSRSNGAKLDCCCERLNSTYGAMLLRPLPYERLGRIAIVLEHYF